MIPLTARTPILLALQPIDFRKQIDGLVAHCRNVLTVDPKSGTFFIFINRARTMIRVLVFDHNGYWVMTKRLSRGTFQWPSGTTPLSPMNASKLVRLLRNGTQDSVNFTRKQP